MAMTVAKMLRICLVEAISHCNEIVIATLNTNGVSMMSFVQRAVDDTKRRLLELGFGDIVRTEEWNNIEKLHLARSILGNASKMLEDLKDLVPANADRGKLALWNTKWQIEHSRAKRAKDLSGALTLLKRTKMAQYLSSGQGQDISGSGMQTMVQTLEQPLVHTRGGNSLQAKEVYWLSASYGSCREVTIEGISFFPSHISYCAKMYKGASYEKLDGFQKEKGMQTMNASLVRCIAFTTMPPWVFVFPLFNGKTIDRMLLYIPYKESSFRPVMERLSRGKLGFRPSHDETPTSVELARMKAFLENMPSIMHALIDGLKAADSQGTVHCDLHASNIVLDFTKVNIARVGIIDWDLMLIDGMVRPSVIQYKLGLDEESRVVLDERRRHGETER